MEHTTSLRDRLGIAAASWADTYPGLAALLSDAAAALEGTARASATDDVLPQPAAWVRNWTSPQPHCVTSLDYRSTADAMDGVQYLPAYSADQMRAAIAAANRRTDYWKAEHLCGNAEIDRLNAELSAQRELHAEAVRGAARYHWLRDAVLHLPDPHKRVWVHEFAGPLAYGDTIDGAIDVAIDIDAQGEAK